MKRIMKMILFLSLAPSKNKQTKKNQLFSVDLEHVWKDLVDVWRSLECRDRLIVTNVTKGRRDINFYVKAGISIYLSIYLSIDLSIYLSQSAHIYLSQSIHINK